jgi:2-amino-4-hydroxy-6-hydroxymethyldihydropteridine diphosphokinase
MILLALGSNLESEAGSPAHTLRAAIDHLRAAGIGVPARSGLYASPAWPAERGGPEYRNAVVRLDTTLGPVELLACLHGIEARFGRDRQNEPRWASRTLDLDLIDYEGRVEAPPAGQGPELPHPRAADRAFVLMPLLDVAPDWRHPATGMAGRDLLARLADAATCRPVTGPEDEIWRNP